MRELKYRLWATILTHLEQSTRYWHNRQSGTDICLLFKLFQIPNLYGRFLTLSQWITIVTSEPHLITIINMISRHSQQKLWLRKSISTINYLGTYQPNSTFLVVPNNTTVTIRIQRINLGTHICRPHPATTTQLCEPKLVALLLWDSSGKSKAYAPICVDVLSQERHPWESHIQCSPSSPMQLVNGSLGCTQQLCKAWMKECLSLSPPLHFPQRWREWQRGHVWWHRFFLLHRKSELGACFLWGLLADHRGQVRPCCCRTPCCEPLWLCLMHLYLVGYPDLPGAACTG